MTEPMSVTGDVMISEPGGSRSAATAMCSAAEPDEHGMHHCSG